MKKKRVPPARYKVGDVFHKVRDVFLLSADGLPQGDWTESFVDFLFRWRESESGFQQVVMTGSDEDALRLRRLVDDLSELGLTREHWH